MVKSAEARTAKTIAKTQPIVVYLRLKALLRNVVLETYKYNVVSTEKDTVAKAIIDEANLDKRAKQNAWECWRELYYVQFNNLQRVEHIVD